LGAIGYKRKTRARQGGVDMAEVTWFKVLTDIFSDDKIKILQSMPEGDALLVMWFKVLAQAGKTNDGGYIYLKKNIPYSPAMLSTLFGKSQQLVELAMRTFSEFGMIDIDSSGYVFVTNWEKHQSIDALDKIKEQTRLRVQNHRDNKRLELQQSNATVTLQVTQGNATDIELELDKDKKIKKEIKIKDIKTLYAEQVSLTDDEHSKLIEKYGTDEIKWALERLSNYKCSKGVKYKSDYHVLIGWVFDDFEKKKLTVVKGALPLERNEQGSTGIHGKSLTPLTDLYAISS
jgi:predicted phage replisome organizer